MTAASAQGSRVTWAKPALALAVAASALSLGWHVKLADAAPASFGGSAIELNGGESSSFDVANTGGTDNGLPAGGASNASPGLTVRDAQRGTQGDAFDNALTIFVDGAQYVSPDTVDVTGTTLSSGPVSLMALDVSVQYYASPSNATLRTFVELSNPGASEVTVPVTAATNMGSDGATQIVATSSGDTTFTSADRYAITDDGSTTAGDPTNTHVIAGTRSPESPPSAVSETVFNSAGTEGILATYDVTVPAGATRSIMLFNQLNGDSGEAGSDVAAFDSNDSLAATDFLDGLSEAQLATVVNFDFLDELYGAAAASVGGGSGGGGGDSTLYSVDPADGSTTAIGPIGFGITGLAVDPTTGTLYGSTTRNSTNDPRSIVTIDRATGAGTLVGSTGLDSPVADIAFRPDGQLVGWSEASDDFVTIDKATGAATTEGDSEVESFGSGMSVDVDGTIFAMLTGNTAFEGDLRTIDAATGLTTVVAGLSGGTNDAASVPAASFACDGRTLYALDGIGGSAPPDFLVTVNTSTGAITEVGETSVRMDGLAWDCSTQPQPEPEPEPEPEPQPAPQPEPESESSCPAGTSAGVTCRAVNGGLAIAGTAGNDVIVASTGNDVIAAAAGNDTIACGAGDDTASGGDGDDDIRCGAGDDTVDGDDGNDSLGGDEDDDQVRGGGGNDGVSGNAGADGVSGNSGDDRVFGRDGDDKVFGRGGNDRVLGGDGDDRVLGDQGNDRISGQDGADRVAGRSGNDELFGGDGADEIFGGTGSDKLFGRPGADALFGRAGDDDLFGDRGDDRLFGERGDDRLVGGDGEDQLDGGPGVNRLVQ